jgi:(p)ppGpp synthase/HD superfamily hydrolase
MAQTPSWPTVLKAADAAAKWHVHRRRKGPAEEPYINHLLEVAMLVADATGGTDTNLVIAALLHDAIEDCVAIDRKHFSKTGMEHQRLVAEN